MKKIYSMLLVACAFTATAQITFTDPVLKSKLVNASASNETAKDVNGNPMVVDTDSNGEIEVSEALNVYALNLGATNIETAVHNIVGLQFFTNLKKLNIRLYYNTALDMTAFPQLEELDCSNSTQLHSINLTGLVNLKKLDCSSILYLSAGLNVSGLTSLQYLNCRDLDLTTLNLAGLTNLIEVIADENDITTLNVAGFSQLKKLDMGANRLTTLNLTGLTSLEYLDVHSNRLTGLNLAPVTTLKYLNFGYNEEIATINVLANPNLETLLCVGVGLTSLNVGGLANLTMLDCSSSQNASFQTSLATLNVAGCSSLIVLHCESNKIASLNLSGCGALEELVCTSNLINTLNTAPVPNLKTLHCSNNPFTTIDLSQNTQLLSFLCYNSKLVTLDLSMQPLLYSFDVGSTNTLKNLLVKNGVGQSQQWSMNYAFGATPNLAYVCCDEHNTNYYQQMINNNGNPNVQLNSYCNFVPGGVYYTLNGSASYDEGNNGCEASDPKVAHMRFNIGNGSTAVNFLSDENGNVTIPVQAGAQTFHANVENSAYFSVSPATVNVNFPATPSPFTQNFCLTANGDFPDLEISMLPVGVARPGFDAKYKLICRNKGTATQSGTIALNFNDPVMDFVSAIPAASSQSSGQLSWNFTNLKPFQTTEIAFTMNINSPVETPPVNGDDILAYTATVNGQLVDTDSQDNTFGMNQTVVNSFDPNDKTCLEGATISSDNVGKYVHYAIRFENTGTFMAENIVVKDMIDTSKYDINSIVPIDGSHAFVTKISAPNKVEFIFENINLPFNDATNDGYVVFKIKTQPWLAVGDTFSNSASIYFDYNHPIVTEPAVTSVAALQRSDFEFADYFTVYPNPAAETLHIQAKGNKQLQSISIYNTLGQMVLAITNAQQTDKIDVAPLPSGSYFLRAHADTGSATITFFKK